MENKTTTCFFFHPGKQSMLMSSKSRADLIQYQMIMRRGEIWVHKTSLNPQCFIEVPVPSQESERSCICVLGVSNLLLLTIMELFRQCGIFCFYYIIYS